MIEVSKSHIHWNYFLALENDLEVVAKYIEFIEANFETYSIELAHLLLASASEVDVVMKELCVLLSPGTSASQINQYKKLINNYSPDLIKEPVYIDRYGLSLTPWSDWNGDKNPLWWRSYNSVKHERHNHFTDANLKNVLNALGALLIVNFYYYKAEFEAAVENKYSIDAVDITHKLQPQTRLYTLRKNYYYRTVTA